ncbi:MAG: nucleotidyltransferase family protein [Candidatus Heimdallarchaeota archaeon]|nr:nucleotidyltransferase family protein [Candidatus Heimdallarchaeota archaeon]
MNKTRTLLKIIGSPLLEKKPEADLIESDELFRYAFRNNVEMLYFQALEEAGKLDTLRATRDEIIARQRDTAKTICRLSEVLRHDDIPHAMTKTLRPYPGTPNDIDCLYLGPLDQYENVGKYLQNNQYRLTGPNDMQYEFFDEISDEAFQEDKSGGRFYIDFYRELAADHMPYMDSQILAKEVIQVQIDECPNPVYVFKPIAEMVVLSLHSVLMHRIVPLEVFYTYAYFIAEMSEVELDELWRFTCLNHAEPAMRTVLTLMETLHQECFGFVPDKLAYILKLSGQRISEKKDLLQNDIHMPHVVRLSTFVISVFSKIRGKRARRGFFKELAHMLNPVFAVEVLYHMLSKKFIDKHSDHV